ncbi:Zinc finger protein 26 [Armadillidium nasatum]|uniref:Zinc finger protein 26 n=1 Tax=Armadillidium nasatum TaxID=96803 RepID=A0A5N5SNX4_9CRUS|nr:Zinc finger protein 26 [Armadillidium nasatum]
MGRRKKTIDPKQMLLSNNLKLKSQTKTSSIKTKTVKTQTSKRSTRSSPHLSPVKTPSKRRGRPKPQAKASAKIKESLSSDESFSDKCDEPIAEQNNNNNNEVVKKNSPTFNNNNNNTLKNINDNNNNNNKKPQRNTSPGKQPSPNRNSASPNKGSPTSNKSQQSSPKEKQSTSSPSQNREELNKTTDTLPSENENIPKKIIASNRLSTVKPEGQKSHQVKCKVCKQWFPNRYFQRKHMLMEHEDQLYECRVCSFNSVDPEKLKSHIIKLHVTKKEKSETVSLDSLQGELEKLIDKKIPRKVMMEDGVTLGRDVNSKMRYICALCNRIYTSKYSLERHVRCHTLEKPYQCDVCNFTSSYREHMMRHMTSVHLIVHSNAPKVKYVPKKKRTSEESAKESNDEENEVQGPSGENSENLSKKRRNILRERFECAVCGLRATHKTDLVEHIKAKHPNAHIESLENFDGSKVHLIVTVAKKPKPTKRLTIQCTYCFLIFHDTWKYKVHLRSHTGVKPFQCSLCDLKATSKMTVRDHIHRKHKGATDAKIIIKTVSIDGSVEKVELPVPWREFKCEQCNEQFNDNYNLKLHKQKNHRDSFPFQCTICEHKELTKAGMVIHCVSTHKNENVDSMITRNGKPIKMGPVNLPTCDFCSKMFSYRSQLNIHMKVHTGEKSFNL